MLDKQRQGLTPAVGLPLLHLLHQLLEPEPLDEPGVTASTGTPEAAQNFVQLAQSWA
ncbi:hypothetical protein [Streptomyces sp. NPDC053069]|uniref:hypothetical protein n=1 Tax=Streptomyces sp. NPDC053069 TaxID=3365695 RepID=UPI0037D3CDD4